MGDRPDRWRRRPRPAALVAVVALVAVGTLVGCISLDPTPTPRAATSPTGAPTATATASASETARSPSPVTSPTATPEPPLSLDLPAERDERTVAVAVTPDLGNGRIVVSVTNLSDAAIREVLLRWPSELREALVLAPFVPAQERIREGGPPLYQEWSRWVLGPGESGEPQGTVTLGYGPLAAGSSVEIPLFVLERPLPGPIAFDLQVLAAERYDQPGALLSNEDGEPAERRVEVP